MLYKYRSFSSFLHLADILLKNRLYAAPYSDLNDPMEGFYLHSRKGKIDEDMQRAISGAKEQLRICSLSRLSGNPLMWSHYADGHRGVVIGVEVTDKDCEVRDVTYSERPPKIGLSNYNPNTPRDVLSTKLDAWGYEEEVRVFVAGRHYVDVEVKEISIGSRMNTRDRSLLIDFCKKVCPEVKIVVATVGYA